MRLPPTSRTRERDARATAPSDGADSSGGLARKLLVLSLGLAAVAYAVSRYVGVPDEFEKIPIGEAEEAIDRSEEGPPTDDAKSAADVVTDAAEPSSDATGHGGGSDTETDVDTDADATDVIDDSETNVDITDKERSAEEISERADENVPEPGEMAVDEDVVEELVNDESTGSEADNETDETDEEDPA